MRRRCSMSKRDPRVSLWDMLAHAREAAYRVEPSVRRQHPSIPWPQIVGMRNRLVHGYDVIDYDLLWDTVTNDLPPLIAALEGIVEES
ncbi:MAG: DUF86 domain-containing protein [bacterium]|nr:DUF86 domain-containing protein [bacterium]